LTTIDTSMNANVKITRLDKPQLSAANAKLNNKLYSIYFSSDKKSGFIIHPENAKIGDNITITEGPVTIIGEGFITDLI